MSAKRLLLLSSSTVQGAGYLEYYEKEIKDFLGGGVQRVLFVPFAGVMKTHEEYAAVVRERFEAMGYALESIHEFPDHVQAVNQAEAMAVGGGNTFELLRSLYEKGLIEAIRRRALDGTPYLGWSAGSNMACPTIRTTNDMPIVEPPSLNALNLISFQINPHYIDVLPEGHQGETREQRIAEFTRLNPGVFVVGLREGSTLRVEGSGISLLGVKPAKVFISGEDPREVQPGDSLQFLLG